jgi:hypothetical protein
MNRFFRRMQRFGKSWSARRTFQGHEPKDERKNVEDARAKSSGHGKKTADKWNQ